MEAASELVDGVAQAASELVATSEQLVEQAVTVVEKNAVRLGGDAAAQVFAQGKSNIGQAKQLSKLNAGASVDGAGALAGAGMGAASDTLTGIMQIGDGRGPRANIRVFREALLNPQNSIQMDPGHILEADDLIDFDKGSEREKREKQQRVLTCILEIGYCVSTMEGYLVSDRIEVHYLLPHGFCHPVHHRAPYWTK
jgi:hypothetical protein